MEWHEQIYRGMACAVSSEAGRNDGRAQTERVNEFGPRCRGSRHIWLTRLPQSFLSSHALTFTLNSSLRNSLTFRRVSPLQSVHFIHSWGFAD
jgi:hypothetical protein